MEALEAVLGEMLESDEIGHRTYNHYVQAMHQFCEWLVPNRLPTNPIAGMTRLNAEIDIRHQRRALTADEFEQLIQSARQSDMSIQCFDGEQRARIYTLSYLTGLRRKEIASLTPGSFRLDDTLPTVTLEAACSKHRKKDTLPLHPELVLMLREWLQGVPREQPLFPKLEKRRTWLMVKKDLERVGIPYKTDQGIADFHAAGRHSHITELVRSGVSLVEARELARHSDVRMTMKYTHIGIEDQARAISKLPWQRKVAGEPVAEVADESLGQRPASGAKRPEGHSETLTGTEAAEKGAEKKVINPRGSGGYDTSGRSMSPSGTKSQKWRRRESNPRAIAT